LCQRCPVNDEPARLPYHVPVMLEQVLTGLDIKAGGTYVDATAGGAGHLLAIARMVGPSGRIIGIDLDEQALAEVRRRWDEQIVEERPELQLFQGGFDDLPRFLDQAGTDRIDGILFDLGVSSRQLDDAGRGFTFRDRTARLDMRMRQSGADATAAAVLNDIDEAELTRILREYSDERWAARIAQFAVERRVQRPFETVGDLVDVVNAAIPAAARPKGIHAATRTFQAIRVFVNDEIGRLSRALTSSVERLAIGGRAVVIAYESTTDRVVKQTFQRMSGKCICPPNEPVCVCGAATPQLKLINRKVLTPDTQEVAINPRSRSARLRVAERI